MTRHRTRSCVLRERKTGFVDIFRTSPAENVCPNFYVLTHANGCTFAPLCDYCYLKSSLWFLPTPEAFSNTDRLVDEVRAWIGLDNLESYVLNSGNLSDSLTFEARRPLMGRLVELFRSEAEAAGRPHTLLLVTKGGTEECRGLLDTPPCRNVVVSFSVNSPEAAAALERGAAPVAERLTAARCLKQAGWRLRIRIDPMIRGYDYDSLIAEVRQLAPERITVGALRAEPNLLRHVNHGLFADLVPAADPKGYARYPLEERLAMFRRATEALAAVCPMGLCEEPEAVWKALGLDVEAKACNCGS